MCCARRCRGAILTHLIGLLSVFVKFFLVHVAQLFEDAAPGLEVRLLSVLLVEGEELELTPDLFIHFMLLVRQQSYTNLQLLWIFFSIINILGNRFSLPNASIMLNQPKSRARGQASDVVIKARETVTNRRVTNEFLAKACGRRLCIRSCLALDEMNIRHIFIYPIPSLTSCIL